MKLLMADDDDIMRSQLRDRIPWKENGYEVVGVAADGKEAYDLAIRHCPQILLTDIKMPFISGIELAEKVKQVIPDCRIIFLTGYDDFVFAKEAIRLQADEYILKGEDEEVILNVVNTVADRVKEMNRQAHLNDLGRHIQRQDFLSKLLQGDGKSEEAVNYMELLGFDTEKYQYRVAVLKADIERNKEDERKPSKELKYARDFVDEVKLYFRNKDVSAYYMLNQQYIVTVLEMEDASDEVVLLLFKDLKEKIESETGKKLSVGIGRIYEPEKEFSLYYDDAVFAIENTDMGEKAIQFYYEMSQTRNIRRIREYILEHYTDSELSLLSMSEKLFLSPSYISSLFKRYMDDNFKTYLIKLRLKKACQLLRTTDDCSYEVAYKVGYPNSQYFSVMFRKYMNMTPSEYRLLVQENGAGYHKEEIKKNEEW